MLLFYGEELLAPPPSREAGGHPLSAVREYLFSIFVASISGRRLLHSQPRTLRALVTREILNKMEYQTLAISKG